MIPMRASSVFKSRWMALIWAAGIIWFAYDFADSQSGGRDSNAQPANAATSDDENALANILGN